MYCTGICIVRLKYVTIRRYYTSLRNPNPNPDRNHDLNPPNPNHDPNPTKLP